MTYVAEIGEFFLARFPGIAMLNPADYTMIAEWEKQKIPVAIVRRSINDCYYTLKDAGIKIESIRECEETLNSNYKQWLEKKGTPGNER